MTVEGRADSGKPRRKRLFGTDGMRGAAGQPPLDRSTLWAFGSALAEMLRQSSVVPRVLIARDTRESGSEIAATLAAALVSSGARAEMAGVLPTPALALLTRSDRYQAGVMVSASHNAYRDNGVKVLSSDGFKLADEKELELEEHIFGGPVPAPQTLPPVPAEDTQRHETLYLEQALDRLGTRVDLKGLRVVLDCAQGAAYRLAPKVFAALGAEVHAIHCEPDGRNINRDCGSLYPEALARQVTSRGADLGIAFDGDADRALVVDERGRLLDGDFLLWRSALDLKARGELVNSTVVATVMSNLWLEEALRREGVALLRARVGDKYVLEEMQRCGAVLGGEQSGHIIYLNHSTTGDGILTGVRLADSLRRARVRLSEWAAGFEPCPQILLNVPVRSKPDLGSHPVIGSAIRQAEGELGERGRLLVRYSGTEALARVMVEGFEERQVHRVARAIADVIGREVGVGSGKA
ncbi:MAG: phosphoglucosamine mutase [Acidobacteriota bacterium]